MQNVPIKRVPNQQFSIVLDDNRWDISLKTTNGTVSVSMTRNNVPIVMNARAVAGMRILPCAYQEDGNFAIATQNQEIPFYDSFGVSQFLVYLSAAELAEIRVPSPALITAAYFDPIAALPLRFAPQGYVQATP